MENTKMYPKLLTGMFFLMLQCPNIYIAGRTFIGCYKDGQSQAMSIKTEQTQPTISSCLALCQKYQYTFTGLENGNECHCGEDFIKHGEAQPADECNKKCSDNSDEICGGVNRLSVYSTCNAGLYGGNCDKQCPHICTTNTRNVCHLRSGKCCDPGTSTTFCHFYDEDECGVINGDPREEVDNMDLPGGVWLNFFKTMTPTIDALVTEIKYFTRTEDRTEHVSFWRHLGNEQYVMVAKVILNPDSTGAQTLTLNHDTRVYIQADDAVALHYPITNENNMIPYQGPSNLPDDIPTESLHATFAKRKIETALWSPGQTYVFEGGNIMRTAAIKIKYSCIKQCSQYFYGRKCDEMCQHCKNNATCHFEDGSCPNGCEPGYTNYHCKNSCGKGSYGQDCEETCANNCLDNDCDHVNGFCKGCKPGYQGDMCAQSCSKGSYGKDCEETCAENCFDNDCDHVNGFCKRCKPGYQGDMCAQTCDKANYGPECGMNCSKACLNNDCDNVDGMCRGCEPGYQGDMCEENCSSGTYGLNCSEKCGERCRNTECHHINGVCNGCEPGYKGDKCDEPCSGYYGINCSQPCGSCWNNEPCEHTSGNCTDGCGVGFQGIKCQTAFQNGPEEFDGKKDGGSNTSAVAGGIVAVLLVATIVIVVLVFVLRKRSQKKYHETDERTMPFSDINKLGIAGSKEEKLTGQSSKDNTQMAKPKHSDEALPKVVKPKISPKPMVNADAELYMNVAVDSDDQPICPTKLRINKLGNYIKDNQQSDEPFQEEFNLLPKDQNGCWDYSAQPDLKSKNRYKNIMPYDEYRVILPVMDNDPLSDYINASFIMDNNDDRRYIASHGPNKATMDDFWRMIWEYKAELIVMLTMFVEQMKIKCDQYWPSEGIICCGGVTIVVEKEEHFIDYCQRHCRIKKGDEERKLQHFHYTSWPDKGVPDQASGILALRKIVKNYQKTSNLPVIIHCSAGVGRTGTFIAIDLLLDQAEREGKVDVLECIRKLRQQRINMVQTLIQYKFVYTAIHEATQVGITQIKCQELIQRLPEIRGDSKRNSGKSQIEKEFEYLEVIKRHVDDELTYVARSLENKDKNRDMNVLPDEMARIVLPSSPATFINAVHVQGYKYKSAFIATQIPLENTMVDFWRLLVDMKCRAIVVLEDLGNKEWFPRTSSRMEVGEFLIQNENQASLSEITWHDLIVQKGEAVETEYANVGTPDRIEPRLFLCTSWDPDMKHVMTLRNLCAEVQNWVDKSDAKNVAVICRNGAAKTGIYIAYNNLFNMMNEVQAVNVMEVVKGIRKVRPQFVSSMAEYLFLYESAAAYVDESQSYANLGDVNPVMLAK